MKTIRLHKQEGVTHTLYPDNQPHVRLVGISVGDEVRVVAPIRSSLELLQLLQLSNALDHAFAKKKELVIPYLMAARFDRVMQPGDSFDLEVIARLINSCGFERVQLFDVHSDVATALIRNSHSHNNSRLLAAYDKTDAVLICPDAGAAKKVGQYSKSLKLSAVVHCIKERNLQTGDLALRVLEPEKCEGKNCVIVDDLCDGGATFIAIAEQIKPLHLTLIVSHGIFSKGFTKLAEHFDSIITSDSYQNYGNNPLLTVIELGL